MVDALGRNKGCDFIGLCTLEGANKMLNEINEKIIGQKSFYVVVA